MTNFKFGDVVLIGFPQSENARRKQRPAIVILDIGDADLTLAPVTSQSRYQPGDFAVSDLKGTGLIKVSFIRLAKVQTLLKSDVVRILGSLTDVDQQILRHHWRKLFADLMAE